MDGFWQLSHGPEYILILHVHFMATYFLSLYLLKWPEIKILYNLNFITVISKLQEIFSIHSIPNVLVPDNGKAFKISITYILKIALNIFLLLHITSLQMDRLKGKYKWSNRPYTKAAREICIQGYVVFYQNFVQLHTQLQG